jgi:glycerophosphoryl diester phosphodiesterase
MPALSLALSLALLLAVPLALVAPVSAAATSAAPIVIAHRGASADRPEHTLAAYALAIEQGADFIEPDLVITKDGVLVARHENEIGETTDVASRPEFAGRRTTKTIDGQEISGWFTEDFTLAELKTLRARERIPSHRPANTAFDGQEGIPTLEEIIALVQAAEKQHGRRIGIYPETKHPSYFRALGLPLEEPLVATLHRHGYRSAADPIFLQSFEVENLKRLKAMTGLRLIQLIAAAGGPFDRPDLAYADMLLAPGLREIAAYAAGIGVQKPLVIPLDAEGRLGEPSCLVPMARAEGLEVHVWTFRPENVFLPAELRTSPDPAGRGDAQAEIAAFLAAGITGLFTDSVPPAVAAVRAHLPATAETPR